MNDIESTTCKRCGRKLRSKKAIEIGMGVTCWRKYVNENNHKRLWEEKEHEEKEKE